MSITKQLLGKVMVTNRGEYNSSTTYEILDIVSYNGSSYISKENDNTDLPASSDSWQLLALKGDTYEVSETDIKNIAKQITDNANSEFNNNVNTKLKEYNDNAKNKTDAYETNASDKLEGYNKNDTDKLSAYNSNAKNKTEIYDTNATEKLNDYNSNASTKLKEYNSNAETKISEFNSSTNVQKITNLSNEFYRVKDEVLETGEASDSYIHVEDSAMAELLSLKIDGVTKQTTTTGKNLLPRATKKTQTIDGITFTINEDGTIVANGTATNKSTLYLGNSTTLASGIYTISSGLNGTSRVRFGLEVGNNYLNTNTSRTETFDSETTIKNSYYQIDSGINVNNLILKPMIEQGSTATDFEPYTGGQPSPSPDYPQEISVLTGDIKLTSCGKNLVGKMVLGDIDPKTGLFRQTSNSICSERYISYDDLKKYYIKINNAPLSVNIRWYNQKLEYIGYGVSSNNGIIDNHVITDITSYIPNDTTPKYFKIRYQDVSSLNSTWCISTDPNYFGEYVESSITVKLPEGEFIGKFSDTNKDYVSLEYNKEEVQYHVVANKYIGKTILDGTQSIVYSAVANVDKFVAQFDVRIKSNSQLVSNRFTFSANAWTADAENIGAGGASGTYIQIKISQSRLNRVDANGIKEYMKNNPTEVYYQLSTPYKIDLGPIDMPLSYDEVANIFTDSDLLPTINAKYYRNFITTIQNLQVNNDTLKNELSNIESRLTALENANTSAVDNNPTEESEVTE